MNLPNKITVFRIILIPVFVVFAVLYSNSLASGMEERWLRFAALATFAIASLSDALDGYIARNYNKLTSLGRTFDPVADKLLRLSGVQYIWNGVCQLKNRGETAPESDS